MPSLRVYRRFLRLLPPRFRREYEAEMATVVEDHWQDLARTGSPMKQVAFWTRQCVSVLSLAIRLRMGWESRSSGQGTLQRTRWTMRGWEQDLKHAVRTLLKQPGFTAVTVLTLALGIGASTAIFSAVHAVLFRDLAYQDADRIVAVFHEDATTGERSTGISAADMRDLAESSTMFSAASVAEPWSMGLLQDGRTETLRTWAVAAGFFESLGTRPALGRTFLEEEYVEGNDKVVVLGYGTWLNRFGGDPGLIGQTVILDDQAYTVVGVLPHAFKYPDRAAAWIPRPPRPWDDPSRAADYMAGVARLAPGASLAEAQAETDRIARSLAESYPDSNGDVGLQLVAFPEYLFGDVRSPLLILLASVGVVLLIACANVAGLMLARGARREREYALRGALGAGRGRIARYVAMESLVLAGLGCALGIALTVAGVRAISALGPDHLPRIDELSVDGVVLGFAVAVAGLSALMAGIAPAFRLSRTDLNAALTDGSRGTTGGKRGSRLRNQLVVLEVGAALVLAIGAGLLGRSFTLLTDEELGFEPEGRVAIQVFASEYETREEIDAFVSQVESEMLAIPGVRSVAQTTNVPGANDGRIASIDMNYIFRIEGRDTPAGQSPTALISFMSPDFHDVMGIEIAQGRSFSPEDRGEAPLVAMVNEAFVRRYLPSDDAVGQRIALPLGRGEAQWAMREIVGVTKDTRPMGFESEPRPEIYFPLAQVMSVSLTFVLETASNADAVVLPASEAIWAVDPMQAVWGAATVESLLSDWLKERSFNLMLFSGFAVIALLLAAIGIYGLVSFSVEQRVGELGIRRALGGRTTDVLGMVMREGAGLATAGVLLGVVSAVALTRFLRGMLFGIETIDWPTFALLSVAVLAVAALATLVPALRASRVDPIEALREG